MDQNTFSRAVRHLLLYGTLSLLLMLLSGCALQRGPGSRSAGTAPNPRNPAGIHVGFVTETSSLDFALEMAAGAHYAAQQYHVSAQIVAPPNFDDPQALKLFQRLMRTARDGIAVETLAPDLFIASEAEAVRQGIPLIAVDTPPPPASHIMTFVGNDNVAAGRLLGGAAIKLIPTLARGSILIGIDNMGSSVLHDRARGLQEIFRQLRPALHLIKPFNAQQPQQINLATWSHEIKAHADLIACLGVGDADNASLAQIKQTSHGAYLSAAFDLNPTALQAVANGTNFALIDPAHFLKGYVAMRLLIEHALAGQAIPRGWWRTDAFLVTQRNVQPTIRRQVSLAAKGQFFHTEIEREFANPQERLRPLPR
jgi:ribose transport system substrate-binding protein